MSDRFQHIFTYKRLRTLLFAIFFINGLIYIPSQSITGDEGDHYNYAARFVKGHPEKIKPFDDASTMPLTAINTIPRILEQLIHPGMVKNDNGKSDIINGRYPGLIAGFFIGLMIYRWARLAYGEKTALFALFLFCFCPNLNAHIPLVTTDAFSALFTILPAFYLWQFFRRMSLSSFFWFAFWLAVAQLAKQSLTWLYPIFFLQGIIWLAWRRIVPRFAQIGKGILVISVTTILVLNVGFQFNETGRSLNEYAFKSRFFSALSARVGLLAQVPIPLPTPYLAGLDYTKNMDEMGGGHAESSGSIYLLGESRTGSGFWYYYFVVSFFKTPIPLLIAIGISAWIHFRRRNAVAYFLLFPVICLLIYFNFFYRSQVGLRHVLMIYPLLMVFAAKAITILNKSLTCIIVAWSVAGFYFYFPVLMAYTNEFIYDKKMAYKIMADSNLDYDNAIDYQRKYLASHKDVKYAPLKPSSGKFLIRTTDLLDLNKVGQYQWLRTNFEPSGHVAFTYLLFDISAVQLKERHLQ